MLETRSWGNSRLGAGKISLDWEALEGKDRVNLILDSPLSPNLLRVQLSRMDE